MRRRRERGNVPAVRRRSKLKKAVLSVLIAATLAGCATKVDYRPPSLAAAPSNSKVVDKPIDEVWTKAVPAIGKQFFVINNLDKSSGLMNLSYSGSPEQYVDCGHLNLQDQKASGVQTQSFPASAADREYWMSSGVTTFRVKRKMTLEGRMNLIFESLGKSQTRITANTKYVVTRDVQATDGANVYKFPTDTIGFNTGGAASFPAAEKAAHQYVQPTIECRPTGALERSVLELIQ